MNYQLTIRPRAVAQARRQFRWYEELQSGLGERFLLSVDRCVQRIHAEPDIFQKRYKEVRVALTDRFPFGVFYFVDENRIIILAIFHMSRDPKRFRNL